MTKLSAEIFDQALAKLKSGSSLEEVLLQWPQHRQELSDMLAVPKMLLSLPKKSVPEPAMRRKYILAPARSVWFAWLRIYRVAGISVSAVLLFTAVVGTGYAAYQSVPGQTLFGVKKTAERLQLKLTVDPVEKASLQMEFAKKRVVEAEQVFKNPQREPKQELAALNELSSETKKTIEAVNNVAKSAPSSVNNSPIVASLEDLTKQQQTLLKEINPKAEITDATQNALRATEENATKVAEIKRYLLAASSEQTLADLNNDDKTATGTAEQLEITKGTGAVEGTSTPSVSSPTPKTQASSTLPLGTKKVVPQEEQETVENVPTNSGTATGSFIIEDPQPQSPF